MDVYQYVLGIKVQWSQISTGYILYVMLYLIVFQCFCAAFSSPVCWLALEKCAHCAKIAFVSQEVGLFGAFAPELDGER